MDISLDFRSHIPIYVQIMEQIKYFVATGELEPGDQLPTVRQLAADLRVNFNTIARTYRMLDELGVISTQHGRGTFILEPASEEATEELRQHALASLTRRYLHEAARLDYPAEQVERHFNDNIALWRSEGTPPPIDSDD
jgi:GntR family transcriptional regulator